MFLILTIYQNPNLTGNKNLRLKPSTAWPDLLLSSIPSISDLWPGAGVEHGLAFLPIDSLPLCYLPDLWPNFWTWRKEKAFDFTEPYSLPHYIFLNLFNLEKNLIDPLSLPVNIYLIEIRGHVPHFLPTSSIPFSYLTLKENRPSTFLNSYPLIIYPF